MRAQGRSTKFNVVIRILPCLAILLAAGDEPAVVLFRSGFERGVVLDPPFVRGGQQWRTISGTDESTGFSWSELPGKVLGFQPLIAPQSDSSSHVEERIVTVLGHDGDSTRVLEQIACRLGLVECRRGAGSNGGLAAVGQSIGGIDLGRAGCAQ